jgi:hypothetical protein
MPESVLMPAPVKATMCSDRMIHRAIFSTCRRRLRSPVTVLAAMRLDYCSQRPSVLARSTSLRLAGFILPSSISFLTLPRLPFVRLLPGRRGVKRSSRCRSSMPTSWFST